MSAVSDSNVALYHLRDELAEPLPKQDVLISVVTEIELLGYPGIGIEEEVGIRALLVNFEIIPLDERVKDETIRLRRTLRLRLPDAIILATAAVTASELLTNDRELMAKAATIVPCRSLTTKPRP